ncbi:TetR/AcrR family transcriptional regulator [Actinocrispum sp. NPDC049592]|uniref:TetR/AcrR family transcriptional regulator n=1 Tax=Actinocrispum sp. NPDC049592 TaxID=3154835 RepID=UPI0034389A1D
MRSPAAARGQEVRQRLLAAAVELIPERGWTAVSTRVLAERAGVTPSVVHYHFPSMPALLSEAAITAMRMIVSEVDGMTETAGSPRELVEGLLASVAQYDGADPMSLLFIETYLAATRDAGLRAQIEVIITGVRERIGEWLAGQGIAESGETAAVLLAAIDGLLLHRGLGSAPDPAALGIVLRRLIAEG